MKKVVICFAVLLTVLPCLKCGKQEDAHLYAIPVGGKWGFIDRTGTVVIQPEFEYAVQFSEDLACVNINEKWGYIDKTGKIVIEPQFDYAEDFFQELALVLLETEKTGYIDKNGEVVWESEE